MIVKILAMLKFQALLITFIIFIFSSVPLASAQTNPLNVGSSGQTAVPDCATDGTPPEQCWVPDPDVQFAGKVAARSKNLLEWVTTRYEWAVVSESGHFNDVWIVVRNIVYALIGICILAAAFLLIITRGEKFNG